MTEQSLYNRNSANAEVMRVFGYLALITGAILLFASGRARLLYGNNVSFLGCVGAYALLAGIGAARLRRWGAVLLCTPLVAWGIVSGVLTVRQEHTIVATVVAFGWLVILLVPTVFAVMSWRDLR